MNKSIAGLLYRRGDHYYCIVKRMRRERRQRGLEGRVGSKPKRAQIQRNTYKTQGFHDHASAARSTCNQMIQK